VGNRVGVISHFSNPTPAEVRALSEATEEAGADWLGLPDAFWWRDTWLLLAEAARATTTLWLGPVVTNPYLRHPFHTLSAIATLQELSGPRILLGLGAGGSEVTGAAGISRRDAPDRIEGLVALLRRVASGAALDEPSGRRLEIPLTPLPVMVAGRASAVLRSAGRVGDRALLWSVPKSDLERSVEVTRQGAGDRDFELVWAPAIAHNEASRRRLTAATPYAVLNSRSSLHRHWGLGPDDVARIRRHVVAGEGEQAAALVPKAALDDLLWLDPDPELAALTAHQIGTTSLAVPVFALDQVGTGVAWARATLASALELR